MDNDLIKINRISNTEKPLKDKISYLINEIEIKNNPSATCFEISFLKAITGITKKINLIHKRADLIINSLSLFITSKI
ncbi:MAG: hypothetical protein ABI840_08100 [bacterium]